MLKTPLPLFLAVLITTAWAGEGQPQPYTNPIDGKPYTAVWKDFKGGGVKSIPNRISTGGVRMLSKPEAFASNFGRGELASYTETAIAAVVFFSDKTDNPASILIDILFSPTARPSIQIASRGAVETETLAELNSGLQRLPDLRSKTEDLRYQIEIGIKPDETPKKAAPKKAADKGTKVIPLGD